jgi:hypothetical protein
MITAGTAALPVAAQDKKGLVTFIVGDMVSGDLISAETVNVAVAAQMASDLCGIPVSVNEVAVAVYRSGQYICANEAIGEFAEVIP